MSSLSSHESSFAAVVKEVYRLRLYVMNRKVFQQDPGRDVKSPPTQVADHDTGENSGQREEVDGYEDTDGRWQNLSSLIVVQVFLESQPKFRKASV